MTYRNFIPRISETWIQSGAVAALLFGLSACVTSQPAAPDEGIGFRQARFEEISAMRSYRACRDDALKLDDQARTADDPARYLASARMIEKCEADLGPEAAEVGKDERMHAYALAVQDYLKGGDVAHAAKSFEIFKQAFSGQDLYFADGSSFVETMEVLLGRKQTTDFGRFSGLNVSTALRAEMRRVRYWAQN